MVTVAFRRKDDEAELRVRRAAARTAVTANKRLNNILPREVYELAGVPVPPDATDEFQRNPARAHLPLPIEP